DLASGIEIYDRDFAEACLHLADALAKGDADLLGPMLTDDAKGVLDALRNDGRWYEETPKIERVRLVLVESMLNGVAASPRDEPDSGSMFVAVQQPGVSYILGWVGADRGGTWTFNGLQSTSDTRARATQWDGVGLGELTISQADLSALGDLGDIDLDNLEDLAERFLNQDSGSDSSGDEPPARDGTRKNTPGGPVTIPGG
ncbi:MAG: hypothetical protein KDA28_05260, partial [Phycisphaerales bacterium]|nr:hypothetical protein [Phycisphaerales bacterium]